MSDGRKSCLGFVFLILGLGLAVLSLVAGGVGELVKVFGIESIFDFKTGLYLAIGVFVVLFVAAMVMFISIRDWTWLPAIFGGVYTILPDLILGPEDDIVALVTGVVLSGLLNYVTNKRAVGRSRPEELGPPPKKG